MKKKISMILSLAMTLGIMSGAVGATESSSVYSTADENGIYTISSENCISAVVPEGETTKWSHNEKYYRLSDLSWTAGEHSLTFGFDFTGDENIGHDVWILTTPCYDYLSGKSVAVGNNEAANIKATFDGWNNQSVSSYKVNVLGSDFGVFWTKVSANTFFEQGENTLKYTALKRSIGNDVEAVFGGAVIVPSYYNWEPVKGNYIADAGKSVIDTGSAFPYAWIELENYDTTTSKDVVRNTNASGGALLEASGLSGKASFTYKFELDEEGTYDIWYLGTDLGVTHLSKFDWGIDAGETDELTASKKLSATSSVYKKPNGGDFAVMWQKTAENVEIGEGVHTLLFEQKTREIENNRWGVADALVIVPSGLEWQPEAVCGDSVKAELDIAALGAFYENKYADPVSENIYMPKMGPAGSRYAYVSADEEIIANDGTIYPSETEELMGAIIVTATKGSEVSEETPVYIVLEKTGNDEPEIPEVPEVPEVPAIDAPIETVEDITVQSPVYVLTPDDVIAKEGKNWTSNDEIYRADVTYTEDTVPEYSLTFGFDHTGADDVSYDIWVLTTLDSSDTTSRPYITLDTEEEVQIKNTLRGWNNLSVSPYKNNLKGTDFKVYWCKASENVLLSKGEHTVKYRIGKSSVAGQKWILGVNGGIFVVPSAYNWTPTKTNKLSNVALNLNIETKFAAPYAWVEAEKYKTVSAEQSGRNYGYTGVASGNGAIDASNYQGTAEFVYDFNLNGTGKYDIWYLGTDLGVDHLSKFTWSIDDSEAVNSKKLSATSTIYKKTDGGFGVMWQKAAEKVEIEGGAHTLTIVQKTQVGSTARWGLMDCFVIVPSSLGWEPGAEISDSLKANLDASAYASALENKYTNGTDTNLYLAQYGAAGSRFAYVSEDETVVSNSGVINPAEFEDKQTQISVTATSGEVSVDKVFTAVILMASDIKVENFVLQNGLGEPLTNLTAGDTIKASASVLDTREIKSGALMIIAVYNADGSLYDSITGKLDNMTDEYKEVSASITLPSDVTGMTVKAFLWDNTTDMYPIREHISNVR